jgi:hypothetical protein
VFSCLIALLAVLVDPNSTISKPVKFNMC